MCAFVTCPKQGLEMEAVVLHRVGFLAYFCPKQGQDFKPSAAPLYPNMGQVPPPGGGGSSQLQSVGYTKKSELSKRREGFGVKASSLFLRRSASFVQGFFSRTRKLNDLIQASAVSTCGQ